MHLQRPTQACSWALPLVSFAEWQWSSRTVFGATDTDMVIYRSLRDKMGILTTNATTPYIGGFPDFVRTGPLVIDYPAGATAGGVGKVWTFPSGTTINAFVKPQYSVFRSGMGGPDWQLFAGVNFQFPIGGGPS